ncbi:MAG: hypothetical protein ACUVQC_00390 [Thermaceae bacterium]
MGPPLRLFGERRVVVDRESSVLRLKREMPEALDLRRPPPSHDRAEAPLPIGKDEAHLLQKLVQEGLVKVSSIK